MPDLSLERALGGVVCGVDEAGRGPLAGPVVAAAAILDPARIPAGIDDSKRLAPARRAALARALRERAIVATDEASVEEIDRCNILQATMPAMRRAVERLARAPDHALVDGNRAPPLGCATHTAARGYATLFHRAALARYGPSPRRCRSFAPVRAAAQAVAARADSR